MTSGRCEQHAKQYHRDVSRWRGSPAERGYDHAWKRVRQQALKRDDYLCVACKVADRITPAVDVDHIIPITLAPERRLDVSNLQSLCRSCHRAKTAHQQMR